jgi:hypothetical protein
MGRTSNESKQRWNAAHYVQVKVSVDKETAAAFKDACEASGTSMARAMSGFMREYAGLGKRREEFPSVGTRRKRRRETDGLLLRLGRVAEAEAAAMDNTPENLRGSERHEASAEIVSALEDALDALREVYA